MPEKDIMKNMFSKIMDVNRQSICEITVKFIIT